MYGSETFRCKRTFIKGAKKKKASVKAKLLKKRTKFPQLEKTITLMGRYSAGKNTATKFTKHFPP